ncbi:hypothetical protein AXG93_4754s1010 [Marchantia polymorpha subsp. ruderalis]|uniref:Alpha-ketoglutarate-dependent dioxygenase AlkB-like domain-containing protein n=1 Tax=Marchantia polymorpha subsp. ruderalis TaxID=1480154 RepID=A0A176WJW0_MARPO|nr:hypothetical protein AXG93_4754s1010 [Marchantia polymorpha subsp. ruderalis]
MASSDLTNQAPNIPGDNRIGGMPGPLPDSQQRLWPDERDAFIHWLKGEFAAANAIIDTLCHHLQMVGKPGEYDFVLTCIQQRRFNWTVVLHMQQYFSVAEVVFALQQVVWMKHTLNSDQSPLPMPFGSSENGGGHHVYRDPRADAMMPGAACVPAPQQQQQQQHSSVSEDLYTRRDIIDAPRNKSEEQSDRRRADSGDQERQQTLASSLENVVYANRDQADLREQGPSGSGSRSVSSLSESSSTSIPAYSQTTQNIKEDKEMDQGSRDQPDAEESSSSKLDRPEGNLADRAFGFVSKEEEDRRQAHIKVTKTYNCIEQVDGKSVNFVDGLELHERVLDKAESSRLAALILEMRAGKRGGSNVTSKKAAKGKGRESLHLSYSNSPLLEDHKKRSSPKDDCVQPMPTFLDPIIERLVRWHIIPASKRPDSCSINIMEEGDYVPPSVDNSHLERPYCTLTLLADCTLILGQSLTMDTPGDFKGSLQILLSVGSVLVFQRNSAEIARHSIAASPTKRIFITMGKSVSSKPVKGNSSSGAGVSQSPPIAASMPQSWNSSFNSSSSSNSSNHNRQGNSTLTHSNSSGRGAAEPSRFGSSFKSHKFTPPVSSGVLPVPTARPPAQIITNSPTSVPPLFSGSPAGGAFPPPSMAIPPSWSPLPRPPPPNRPPSAGTGVFFPSSGASSGPGRPMNMTPGGQRRAGAISPAPPILQKTNSAPASFASLEAAATAAASSPSTPPSTSKASKLTSSVGSSSEKARAAPSSPHQDSKSSNAVVVGESSDASSSAQSVEANGVAKFGKEDSAAASARNSGSRSKSMPGNNRTSMISTIGGHS